MKSVEIRQKFLDFFKNKGHQIVPSAPIVLKNDTTLMFTNAGMNQFKDIFLGNIPPFAPRVANTQKCLRVSGKHNDLEEVGLDTYHHTMFEMLGNWSFGDYFKNEAIEWAWELLVNVYGIDSNIIYATYFGGDDTEHLTADILSKELWEKFLPPERVIAGSKKDNFWEMGDTGPCGPCSEIHVDLRNEEDKNKIPGYKLVNAGHPLVIEIWNLVFIEFQRMNNGKLQNLNQKHVDTGMGLERLCMVLQDKKSNYDTDIFQTLIGKISELSGKEYGNDPNVDIAMRVVSDHIRAVVFSIADGQLPSNNKAGYVIRRILRRAIRYAYTFLDLKEPFMFELVDVLSKQNCNIFPELETQKEMVKKVIIEEEQSFLKTLSFGIQKFDNYLKTNQNIKLVDGNFAFELFDTYGFPVDLTRLMAKEAGIDVDMDGFEKCMNEQKKRSRDDAQINTLDWIVLAENKDSKFVGYDTSQSEVKIIKYRKINFKGKEMYQLVFDQTPFYAESGGQVGDTGYIIDSKGNITYIMDTKKENNLTIHFSDILPEKPDANFLAVVDIERRQKITNNHTATHLMHYALRQILGKHIEQRGSLVESDKLRFDFSHFQKLKYEEIIKIENLVNELIRKNIPLTELRDVPLEQAKSIGAMALFGEKYSERVRVIKFDDSIELCGGLHVKATGQIGYFKIISESAIAAGIRRIEAVTGKTAEDYVNAKLDLLNNIYTLLKNPPDILKAITQMNSEISLLNKKIEELNKEKTLALIPTLANQMINIERTNFLTIQLDYPPDTIKDLLYAFRSKYDNFILIIASNYENKAMLSVMLSDDVLDKGLDASVIVKLLAKEIDGGGGGQKFYAVAGGKKTDGITKALSMAKEIITEILLKSS